MIVERWTEGTGGRLRYFDNAPDEPIGLPIFFSPGLTDTADEYVEALETFLPRRAIVVEVRGRGQSDAPPPATRPRTSPTTSRRCCATPGSAASTS